VVAARPEVSPVLIEVASVVVANAHNPSILNHDWLVANNVLPESPGGWELAEPPFTTAPLSNIHYQSGIRIVLDPVRLVVTAQTLGSSFVGDSRSCLAVSSLAATYVATLKHIPYVAVGSNFKAYIECGDAQRRLVETFGGSGRWTSRLESMSVKLNHSAQRGCERHLELASTTTQKAHKDESKTIEVISMSANYHRDTRDNDAVLEAIGEAESDLDDFLRFATDFGSDIDV